jgi:fimbrial isopeptide formation D2 family protein
MNLLPNKTSTDSTRSQARKRRLSKMHILRVSVLAMFAMMLIVGGATFSNVFTSAVQAAPHIGKAKAGLAMPRVGSVPPDLAITSVTPALSATVASTETINMSNLGGTAFRDATTPNFVQVNIQVSGLIAVNATPALTTPVASGTNWICGPATASKSITPTSVVTIAIPVTYSFNCNYNPNAFPIVTGALPSITVTGAILLPSLLTVLGSPIPIKAQLVTLYDTNPANNNFSQLTTLSGVFLGFNLSTAGLSKTLVSGTPPFAPGQQATYRLQPTLSGLTNLLPALTSAAPIVLFMDDYLPPGQTFSSFTSNGSITIGTTSFSWSCNPIANTLDTNVTDVQCSLPLPPAFLTAGGLVTLLTTGGVLAIPSVDITGTFNSAAQALDYATNYTNTADFYFLDPPAGVAAFDGAVTTQTVQTTTGVTPTATATTTATATATATATTTATVTPTPGGATVSLSKTGSISGNTVTFTLTPSIVGTSGSIPAGTVITISDALPGSQLALSSAVITSTTVGGLTFAPLTLNGNLLTTSITTTSALAPGAALPVITITVPLVSGATPCSFIQNEATISAPGFLPVVVSSVVQVPGTACGTPTSGAPALSLSKTGVRHGNVISYTLLSSIVGGGSVPAGTVITLTDALPMQLTLVPGSVLQSLSTTPWTINVSGNTITATLTAPAGGIAAGTVLPAITFDAQIKAGIKQGTIIENEATISAPGFAPVSASSTIEIGEQHQQCRNNCHHENECKNNCHHENECKNNCHHENECRNDRDDCHHQCAHVANWECECPRVANWDNWECDHNNDHGHSHNNNDANNHNGSSKGGNKIIIINEANSSSKSHSGSASNSSSNSHSNADSKGGHNNNADAKSHSGSVDSKNHSSSSDAKSHSGSVDSKNHSESKDSKSHSGSSDGRTEVIVIKR